MAPEWLGKARVGETPATDVKSVEGRVIEATVSDFTDDKSKYYMRLGLRMGKPEGKDVPTGFHSLYCVAEYVMRLGRKGLGKVPVFVDVETKDGWKLQLSVVVILNRKGNREIKSKARAFVAELLASKAKELSLEEFVKATMAGVFQMKIKKGACKIYPVRLAEITKIETLKRPAQ